jgi:hypothetical protein
VLGEALRHPAQLGVQGAGSAMSRGNVSSFEIEIRSMIVSTGRGSMPRARSRSNLPTFPGRSA